MDRSPESPSIKVVASIKAAFIQNLKAATSYKFWVEPLLKGVVGKVSNRVTVKTRIGGNLEFMLHVLTHVAMIDKSDSDDL